jgi:hypothetical protein
MEWRTSEPMRQIINGFWVDLNHWGEFPQLLF